MSSRSRANVARNLLPALGSARIPDAIPIGRAPAGIRAAQIQGASIAGLVSSVQTIGAELNTRLGRPAPVSTAPVPPPFKIRPRVRIDAVWSDLPQVPTRANTVNSTAQGV